MVFTACVLEVEGGAGIVIGNEIGTAHGQGGLHIAPYHGLAFYGAVLYLAGAYGYIGRYIGSAHTVAKEYGHGLVAYGTV